ncbi:winged helix-turn-helix transcriptional regulator [Phytohabitans rumicis]|uniref:Transcriptional regulator n=1 Tax=Phytohabitans rumicis TaxID=1076125 RepID=A0A6V8LFD0_9ACTN|nr:helix-turn-helix domain-containing protein [Phytohabitans rumicis]GFJ93608.1 transcriptional regulator [Phytohabitans rumicis]
MVQSRLPLHACSYTEEVFRVLGKRWTGLLIDLLLQRPARFSELAAALPQLSKRVLSERLAELQDVGLVIREVDDGRPVSVGYRLTERGQGLSPAMDALRVWAGAPVDEHGQPLPYSAATHSDEAG